MKAATLLSLTLLTGSAPALDLTPQFSTRDLEGFAIPIIRFSDDGRKINYQPPAGWRVSGGGSKLSLLPGNLPDAIAKMQVFPRTPEMGTSDTPDELKAWAMSLLPLDSTKAVLQSELQGQFTLETHPSQEYTFAYVQQGIAFIKSVAIVELGEAERFVLTVAARENDFKTVHEEAIASMFSWEWQQSGRR